MCALKTTYSFLSVGSLPSRMATTLGADFFSRVAIRACACSWTSPKGLASNAAADCAPARSSPSCATIGWNDDIRMSRIGPPMELLGSRSEEHTSELQSQSNLVCRLLLEKKKISSVETERH